MNACFQLVGLLPFFGTGEILVVLVVGVLLFGKRLPEIAGTVAKTVMDFKRSLQGLQDEFSGSFLHPDRPVRRAEPEYIAPKPPRRLAPTVPKFVDDDLLGAASPVHQTPSRLS